MKIKAHALFLHDRLILNWLDNDGRRYISEAITSAQKILLSEDAARIHAFEGLIAQAYEEKSPPELDVAVLDGSIREDMLITITQAFYLSRQGEERKRIHAKLSSNQRVTVEGEFSNHRCVGSTGRSELSGRVRITVLAFVSDINKNVKGEIEEIHITPVFIGRLHSGDSELSIFAIDDRRETWAGQVDQFAEVDFTKRPTKKDLEAVESMPEKDVKRFFAEVIGEAYVSKDWGGERSDLYSANLSIEGKRVAAAFAFKGPSIRGDMHIADMGKNGDQALRLFREPADLLVVQHCRRIDPEVRNLMSAFARNNQKRFMVLDGQDTAQILKAYGKLHASEQPGP